jgi:hypothetical protein
MHIARTGKTKNVHQIFVGKPDGNRPDHTTDLGINDREDNIKMDLREVGLEDVDWIHLA